VKNTIPLTGVKHLIFIFLLHVQDSVEAPEQPGFYLGKKWDPTLVDPTDESYSPWHVNNPVDRWGVKHNFKKGDECVELMKFLTENPLDSLELGFNRTNLYVEVEEPGTDILQRVFFSMVIQNIGTSKEPKPAIVLQSDVMSGTGIPAVTVANCDCVEGMGTLLSDYFPGTGVGALITDIPWGETEKVGYNTSINWESFVRNLMGDVVAHSSSLSEAERVLDHAGKNGEPLFVILGTLELLTQIAEQGECFRFSGYTNLPGVFGKQ